jgi:hypothetical protein
VRVATIFSLGCRRLRRWAPPNYDLRIEQGSNDHGWRAADVSDGIDLMADLLGQDT